MNYLFPIFHYPHFQIMTNNDHARKVGVMKTSVQMDVDSVVGIDGVDRRRPTSKFHVNVDQTEVFNWSTLTSLSKSVWPKSVWLASLSGCQVRLRFSSGRRRPNENLSGRRRLGRKPQSGRRQPWKPQWSTVDGRCVRTDGFITPSYLINFVV